MMMMIKIYINIHKYIHKEIKNDLVTTKTHNKHHILPSNRSRRQLTTGIDIYAFYNYPDMT